MPACGCSLYFSSPPRLISPNDPTLTTGWCDTPVRGVCRQGLTKKSYHPIGFHLATGCWSRVQNPQNIIFSDGDCSSDIESQRVGLNTQQTARERERARRIKGGDRRGADVRCWLLCSEAALKIRILINGASLPHSLPSSLHQQTKDGGRRSSISGTDRVSRRLRLRQISHLSSPFLLEKM